MHASDSSETATTLCGGVARHQAVPPHPPQPHISLPELATEGDSVAHAANHRNQPSKLRERAPHGVAQEVLPFLRCTVCRSSTTGIALPLSPSFGTSPLAGCASARGAYVKSTIGAPPDTRPFSTWFSESTGSSSILLHCIYVMGSYLTALDFFCCGMCLA